MSSTMVSQEFYFCWLGVVWLGAKPSIFNLLISKEPDDKGLARIHIYMYTLWCVCACMYIYTMFFQGQYWFIPTVLVWLSTVSPFRYIQIHIQTCLYIILKWTNETAPIYLSTRLLCVSACWSADRHMCTHACTHTSMYLHKFVYSHS